MRRVQLCKAKLPLLNLTPYVIWRLHTPRLPPYPLSPEGDFRRSSAPLHIKKQSVDDARRLFGIPCLWDFGDLYVDRSEYHIF